MTFILVVCQTHLLKIVDVSNLHVPRSATDAISGVFARPTSCGASVAVLNVLEL